MAGICTCKAWLIAGIPLDRNDQHQLIFQSQSAQLAYFQGKAVAQMVDAQYIKKDRVLSFDREVDGVDSANYLLFKNEDFDGRYYFAYIVDKDYTNPMLQALSLRLIHSKPICSTLNIIPALSSTNMQAVTNYLNTCS